MKYFNYLLVIFYLLPITSLHAQNVGVGTDSPVEFFSVGASSQFRVNASGDLVRINNVQYSFPATQATSGSVLANDGSGNLSWTKVTTGNISATGTANNTTFLRGDGAWTSAGGESVSTPVNATFTGLTSATNAFASSGANQVYGITFVTSGTYMVVVNAHILNVPGTDCLSMVSYLLQNGTDVAYGQGSCGPINTGSVVSNIVKLLTIAPGDVITVRVQEYSGTRTVNGNISFTRLY